MQPLDFTKAKILLFLYCIFAPILGVLIRNSRWGQRLVFLAFCFCAVSGFLQAQEWGLTIHPILYRGTARGFHFYWAEVAAVALIVAQMAGNWRNFRFFPPGFWLYALYCAASCISIMNAPKPLYGYFAAFKAIKIIIAFVAAYNFVRSEEDLRFALVSLAFVILWELIAVLYQKYAEHIYQVWGTFEHQNSLSMYAILIGMVFLAVALGPRRRSSNFFLFAFISCTAIVQSGLSRAGLMIFALGTIIVVALSIADRLTRRRLGVVVGLSCIAVVGLALTLDTIVKRFYDYGNEESAKTREMLNESSRWMLEDYPLGVGWNNFAVTINYPYPYSENIDYWQKINNDPVDKNYKKGIVESLWWLLLSETGYQGFATYLLFIAMFLWWNLRNAIYYRREYLGAVSVGLLVGSSMNYLQSFLEHVLTQPRNIFLWLTLLAITARITTWRKGEQIQLKREREEKIAEQKRLMLEEDEEAAVA